MTPNIQQCPVPPRALHDIGPADRPARRQRALLSGIQKAVALGAIAILPMPVVATTTAQAASASAEIRTVSQKVALVSSYEDISNLHYRFIELLDQRDNVGMAALFANGTFELNYGRSFAATGEANVLALLRQLFPTPPTAENWSRHIVSNLIIEIDEALGTAATRMYSSAWGVRAGQPSHFRGLGRHVGQFERINGEWVFKDLVIYADVDYPYPVAEPTPPTFQEVVTAFFTAVAERMSRFGTAVSEAVSTAVANAVRFVNAVITALFPSTAARHAATVLTTVENEDDANGAASAVTASAMATDDDVATVGGGQNGDPATSDDPTSDDATGAEEAVTDESDVVIDPTEEVVGSDADTGSTATENSTEESEAEPDATDEADVDELTETDEPIAETDSSDSTGSGSSGDSDSDSDSDSTGSGSGSSGSSSSHNSSGDGSGSSSDSSGNGSGSSSDSSGNGSGSGDSA